MKEYTVAILGATGAVGQEMRKRLEERNFPVGRLKLLASTRSAGKTVMFRGQNIPIEEANEAAFQGVDLVLGAAENEVAIRFAPAIRVAGAVFVDNSSAFRMDPTVPLVVPEVNPQDAALHTGIVANPNCSTIITVTAIAALNRLSPSPVSLAPASKPSVTTMCMVTISTTMASWSCPPWFPWRRPPPADGSSSGGIT